MNKKILMFSMIFLSTIILVSAGIYLYVGSASVDVIINEALSVDAVVVSFMGYPGETLTENIIVRNDANVALTVDLTYEEQSNDNTFLLDNSEGTCDNYPDAGWREECEKRIVLDGMLLSELDTISWDANVFTGYAPHVDLILSNGESLTFEYATIDADCNVPSTYPTGEINTFDDMGIIDDNAYAWESLPGACGVQAFDDQHLTLAAWKSIYSEVTIDRIELEVDNWIPGMDAPNSSVQNIIINGEKVSVVTYTDDMPKTVTVDAGPNVETLIPVSFTINEDSQIGEFAGVVNVERVASV